MKSGLIPVEQEDESESQPAQNLEAALKKRREKLAFDKYKIAPEPGNDV
jgi:hypothetical protein